MSVLKKIMAWLMFIVFAFILLGITYIIYCWAHCGPSGNSITKTLTNDKDSKIAVFKPDSDGLPKIRMQRFLIKEPYKYPFYSAQNYSDDFFINFQFSDSLVFVVDNKDTVRWGDLYVIDTVPLRIKGYDHSGTLRVTYYQDTLFQSNIVHKPSVSILKQINFGPIAIDSISKCK